MKSFKNCAAQGDIYFKKLDAIPEKAQVKNLEKEIVLSHSETGHNHSIDLTKNEVVFYTNPDNAQSVYIEVKSDYADVVHHRSFDTHETVRVARGCYEVRRQREATPEGYARMVVD